MQQWNPERQGTRGQHELVIYDMAELFETRLKFNNHTFSIKSLASDDIYFSKDGESAVDN